MWTDSLRRGIGSARRWVLNRRLYCDLDGSQNDRSFEIELPSISDAVTGERYAPPLRLFSVPRSERVLDNAEVVNCSFTGCVNAWDIPLIHLPKLGYSAEPLLNRLDVAVRFGRPHPSFTASQGPIPLAFPAIGPYSANWYHSLIDQGALISRWYRLKGREAGSQLILSAFWKYRWPQLPEIFGLNESDYVWMGEDQITCDALWVPLGCRVHGANKLGRWDFAHPEDVRNLRTLLLRALGSDSIFGGKCIVIDRGDGWRAEPERVRGFSKLKDQLVSRHGFESIKLGELSPRDQLRLYRDSAAVVAEHGAGLAGMICSSTDTTIIEVFPTSNRNMGIYGFSLIRAAIPHQKYFTVIGAENPNLAQDIAAMAENSMWKAT